MSTGTLTYYFAMQDRYIALSMLTHRETGTQFHCSHVSEWAYQKIETAKYQPCEKCGVLMAKGEWQKDNEDPRGTPQYVCQDCPADYVCDHAPTGDETDGCQSCGSNDCESNDGFGGEGLTWCNSCGFTDAPSHDETVSAVR